jgi:tyrosyl-tRNA synthetase
VQGYDFYYLNKHQGVQLQMGGSDQWGNIVTGTELIRKIDGGEAFALTTPLIKKADGTKFGKTEGGNIWLDPKRTSPYAFYQFWLRASDDDVKQFIRIFSLKSKAEIEAIESRLLQKELAKEVTIRVHGEQAYNNAVRASEILFGKGTKEELQTLDEATLLEAMEGVPQANIAKSELTSGINIVDFLSEKIQLLPSKTEARKMIQANGISINKNKISEVDYIVNENDLINEQYILAQKGKREYCLVKIV